MGWTAPRTWVASEVVTAAIMNTHVRDNLNALNGFVRKTADQSVTSSTVAVNDTHLLYTIGATGTYEFEFVLFGVSAANAAGDLAVGLSFPTGTCSWGVQGLDPAVASSTLSTLQAGAYSAAVSGTSLQAIGLSTSETVSRLRGELVATATGTLRLIWAQFASNANASTLKAGSFMTVKQVA